MSNSDDPNALAMLADGAVFIGIGAALGVFGYAAVAAASSASSAELALWSLSGLALLVAGFARGAVGRLGARALSAAAAALGLPADADALARPLSLLAPAAALAAAGLSFGAASGLGAVATTGAALLALGALGWTAARLAAPALAAVAPAAAAPWVSRGVGVAATLIVGVAALELLGAPVGLAVVAIAILALAAALLARETLSDRIAAATLTRENTLRVGDFVAVFGAAPFDGRVIAIGAQSVRLRRADGATIEAPARLFITEAWATLPGAPTRAQASNGQHAPTGGERADVDAPALGLSAPAILSRA